MALDDKPVEASKVAGGSYDREAILNKLANLENFDVLRYLMKNEKVREKVAYEESSKRYQPRNANPGDTDEESKRSRVASLRKALEAVPDSMLHAMMGSDRPAGYGRLSDQKPEWLDEEKLLRGQKFAQDHLFPVYYAEIASLFAFYSFTDGFKPMIMSGKSSTPFMAFRRYLSTALIFRNWYTQDHWSTETTAWKDFKTVRAMHDAMRPRLDASTYEEIDICVNISLSNLNC